MDSNRDRNADRRNRDTEGHRHRKTGTQMDRVSVLSFNHDAFFGGLPFALLCFSKELLFSSPFL
jgi:hypothetical protein